MSGVGVVTIPCRNTLFPDSTTCTAVCASHHMVILHLRMLPLKLELPILLNVTLTRLVCSLLRLFCCLLHLLETLPREGLRHPERFLIGGQRRAQSLRDILVYHEISPYLAWVVPPHASVTNSERASAMRAGFASPSISMVLRNLSKIRPLPCGSAASNTTRSRTRDPDFTGARKRTLSRPSLSAWETPAGIIPSSIDKAAAKESVRYPWAMVVPHRLSRFACSTLT